MIHWMKSIAPGLKKVFLVHGEAIQMEALKTRIEQEYGLPVEIPRKGDSFLL